MSSPPSDGLVDVRADGHRRECEVILKRIVYCSQATHDVSPEELLAILDAARTHNSRAGLTGMLLYCGQSFLQLLEGDAQVLEQTYARIASDVRHTNLRLLLNAEVDAPLYPDWTMGFEHVDDEELAERVEGFTAASRYPLLNPDLITDAGVALSLLSLYARNKVA